MSESITPWIHIVAVTVWLGPQFFLFVAAIPAIRVIDDPELRLRVLRIVVTRFGWMAWAALAIIVLSGVSNLFQVGGNTQLNWSNATDFRYFHIFSTKMALVGAAVLLTALHTFVIGPRQLRLMEEMRGDSPEAAGLRRASMIVSGTALLFSIAVVYVAALLANHEYSLQPI